MNTMKSYILLQTKTKIMSVPCLLYQLPMLASLHRTSQGSGGARSQRLLALRSALSMRLAMCRESAQHAYRSSAKRARCHSPIIFNLINYIKLVKYSVTNLENKRKNDQPFTVIERSTPREPSSAIECNTTVPSIAMTAQSMCVLTVPPRKSSGASRVRTKSPSRSVCTNAKLLALQTTH